MKEKGEESMDLRSREVRSGGFGARAELIMSGIRRSHATLLAFGHGEVLFQKQSAQDDIPYQLISLWG